jgi:hypothetical protein
MKTIRKGDVLYERGSRKRCVRITVVGEKSHRAVVLENPLPAKSDIANMTMMVWQAEIDADKWLVMPRIFDAVSAHDTLSPEDRARCLEWYEGVQRAVADGSFEATARYWADAWRPSVAPGHSPS